MPGDVNINFDPTKPVTVMVEKIANLIGAVGAPAQIKRIAKAESEALLIRTDAENKAKKLELIAEQDRELVERTFHRIAYEETRKQENIESITTLALPQLDDDAKPENVDDDWLLNFLEKCRITSSAEMQQLWARILAGQANNPGEFSKRTVNFVAELDKSEAEQFTTLCRYCWNGKPLIYDVHHPIYTDNGINFQMLSHLDHIGLITFSPIGGYRFDFATLEDIGIAEYFGQTSAIRFREGRTSLSFGHVMMTQTGVQLEPICNATPVPGFRDFIHEQWREEGVTIIPDDHISERPDGSISIGKE